MEFGAFRPLNHKTIQRWGSRQRHRLIGHKRMKRLKLLGMLFVAVPLCGSAQNNSAPGISFDPPAGTIAPGQSVTVTATGAWASPATIFCTTDGSPANIAATLVGSVGSGGGSLAVLQGPGQTTETLNCIGALGAVTYQNVN